MDSSSTVIGLVDKLSHRIFAVRDRSMKALCHKFLSPLVSTPQFDALARVSGSAHLILQWINDRYDDSSRMLMDEVMLFVLACVRKSEGLRELFIEAGVVSFLEDFSQHNAAYSSHCEAILKALVHINPGDAQLAITMSPHRKVDPLEQPITSPESLIEMSPSEEQSLFDLSVRIKFSTSTTTAQTVADLVAELRFGLCRSLPGLVFVQRPSLIEAVCCQLSRQTPSLSAIKDCEGLAQGLVDLLERICGCSKARGSAVAVSVLMAAMEFLHRRPELAVFAHRIVSLCLKISPHFDRQTDVDNLLRTLDRLVANVFPEESYLRTKLNLRNASSVEIRQVHAWTLYRRIVAELTVSVLTALREGSPSLRSHMYDWLGDPAFYQSHNRMHSLAASACISVPDDEFTRAKEILLVLRKQRAGEYVSVRDWADLFFVWRAAAPELCCGESCVGFLTRLFEQPDVGESEEDFASLCSLVLGSDRELGNAFVSMLSNPESPGLARLLRRPSLVVECLAFASVDDPAALVDFLGPLSGLEIFSPKKSCTEWSLIQALFSSDPPLRRQAALILFKTHCGGHAECGFIADPLNPCFEIDLSQFRVGCIPVEVDEVRRAIAIAFNERLSLEIRSAAAVQASTLLASSSGELDLPHPEFDQEGLADVADPSLFLDLCQLGALLVRHKTANGLGAELAPLLIRRVFTEGFTPGSLLLLSRLAFGQAVVCPQYSGRVYQALLKRLAEVGFRLDGFLENQGAQGREAAKAYGEPSMRTLGICVSLTNSSKPVPTPSLTGDVELAVLAGQMDVAHLDHLTEQIRNGSADACIGVRVCQLALSRVDITGVRSDSLVRLCEAGLESAERQGLVRVFVENLVLLWRLTGRVRAVGLGWVKSALGTSLEEGLGLVLTLVELDALPAGVLPILQTLTPVQSMHHSYVQVATLWLLCKLKISIDVQSLGRLASRSRSGDVRVLAFRMLREKEADELTAAEADSVYASGLEVLNHPQAHPPEVFLEACMLLSGMVGPEDSEILVSCHSVLITDAHPSVWSGAVCLMAAVARSNGGCRSVSQLLLQQELWGSLLAGVRCSQCASAALDLVAACLANDARLVAFLVHSNLLACISHLRFAEVGNSLVVVVRAMATVPAAVHWLQSIECVELIEAVVRDCEVRRHARGSLGLDLVEAWALSVGSLPRHTAEGLIDALCAGGPGLSSLRTCAVLTLVLRLPGVRGQESSLIEILQTHKSTAVPDSAGPGLFFAQARLAAAWAAASRDLALEYCSWFSSVWVRGLQIPHTKQTSPVPLLLELVTGLVEVLAQADLGQACWGAPISHVMSLLTNQDQQPHLASASALFSLCLSVGEMAQSVLAGKAVTGRIVAVLISVHATIHGRSVPKDPGAIGRAAAVIRFCSSVVGCPFAGMEILKSIDGWLEVAHVVEPELLARVGLSLVLAGGRCRLAAAANSGLVKFLKSLPTPEAASAIQLLEFPAALSGG